MDLCSPSAAAVGLCQLTASLSSSFPICKTGCPEDSEDDGTQDLAHSVWRLINSKSEASGLSITLLTYGESVLAAVHKGE